MPAAAVGTLAFASAAGWQGVVHAGSGLLLCAAVPALLFVAGRWIGGGDVKLLASIGALLGPFAGLEAQWLTMLAALAWWMIGATWRGELWSMARRTARAAYERIRRRGKTAPDAPAEHDRTRPTLPLGPAAFLGTLWTVVGRGLL